MPENTSSAGDRTVVVTQNRHGLLTVISLSFNALFLLLILIGIVCHHRHHHHFRDRGEFGQHGGWGHGGGMRFHHHDFGGMNHGWRGGPGCGSNEQCGSGGRFGDDGCQGWGKEPDRGSQNGGFHGGPGNFGSGPAGGFGPSGGMNHFQPPTAAGLTDHIMQHLDEQLALTPQETTQIRPVIEQQVTDLQKNMEAARQALQKSVDDTSARIRPLLTADQQKKLDEIKAGIEQKFNQAKPADSSASPK